MPETSITPEKLAELKTTASRILAETRMALQRQQPFIGSVSMSLDLVPTRDARNPTAATDGSSIYFDIAFLAELKPEQRMFTIAHEVWHNVMMHFIRQEGRDQQLWNIAADMEINAILEDDGLMPPQGVCRPDDNNWPHGLSAEEYYAMLLKKREADEKLKQLGGGDGGSGQESQQDGGSSFSKQFDRHMYEGEELEPAKEGEDRYGKVGEDSDFMPKPDAHKAEKIREAATSAAQEVERLRGELPGSLKRLVDKLLEPKVDWKDVLARFITRNMANEPTWNRPNRRFAAEGIYLPGHEGTQLNVAVVLDTSGSTVVAAERFLTELNAIVDGHPLYKLTVIHCDTQVQHVEEWSNECPLDLSAPKYEFHGGGGTRLQPALDYVDVNGVEADVIVVLTDGLTEKFDAKDAPNVPVLWLLTEKGNEGNYGFGEVVHFKKEP